MKKISKPDNAISVTANWETTKKERSSYYSYFFGQNMIYVMVASYLTSYLAISGINPIKSGAVMLAVKIWDAINDAIFGVIFDKIKFKSGKKYLPWLKIAAVFTPAATIALFFIPQLESETAMLVYFALAYILWDTAYTLCDVPAFGIITAMTSRIEERNSVLSIKTTFAGIGTALASVLITTLNGEIGLSFGVISIIVAVVAIATMFPVCFTAQERRQGTDEEQFTVRRMIKYLFSNKYLLIYYIGYVFYSGGQFYNSMHMIFSYYIYEDTMASLITGTVAAAPQLILAMLVPKIIRKYDKMKVFRIAVIATILTSFLILPTRNNFWLFTAAFLIRSLPLSVVGILGFLFTPDCAEYGQYKTGIDAKGITFAIQTFAVKLAAALQSALVPIILGVFGFISIEADSFEALEKMNAIGMQPEAAIDGVWYTYNLFPIIGIAIACVIWFAYKLNDKDVQIMTDCNSGKITKEEAESMLSKKY